MGCFKSQNSEFKFNVLDLKRCLKFLAYFEHLKVAKNRFFVIFSKMVIFGQNLTSTVMCILVTRSLSKNVVLFYQNMSNLQFSNQMLIGLLPKILKAQFFKVYFGNDVMSCGISTNTAAFPPCLFTSGCISPQTRQGGSRTTCLTCFRDHILLQSL